MNNVPEKIKKIWRNEDLAGMVRACMRSDEGDCNGRVTKEHAMYFGGKQIQEDWAILDICAYHTEVDFHQDGGGMNKEKHVWIALNRAPEERLRTLSRAMNYIAERDRLNAKYGTWCPVTTNLEIHY